MTVQYLKQGTKRGVFIPLDAWRALQKELEALHVEISNLKERRAEILRNFIRSKKEKKKFSSDISELKGMLK